MRTWAAGLVVAVLLASAVAGCGDDGDGSAAGEPRSTSSGSTSPTAATSSPAPRPFVESETCRAGMAPLVDIMLANDEHSLAYDTFHDRYNELVDEMDQALLACSNEVNRPARMVMVKYGLADLAWRYCTATRCAEDLIARDIRAGLKVARRISVQLDATA